MCPLQKERNLLSAIICSPRPGHWSSWQILDFPKNTEPESSWPERPTGKKWTFRVQVWCSGARQTCPGGWLCQCSHLRKRSMWSGWDDHKEASGVDLLPFSPWRTRSVWVSQDTAASPGSSKGADTVRGGWRVAPWVPPLSPAPPLLQGPAPLSYHEDCAFGWQVFLQSSNVRKLFLLPLMPPNVNGSQWPVLAL